MNPEIEYLIEQEYKYNQLRPTVIFSLLAVMQLLILLIAYVINVDLQMLASIKKMKKYENKPPLFFLILRKMTCNFFLRVNYRHPELFEKRTLFWSVMLANVLEYVAFLQIGLVSVSFALGYRDFPDITFAIYIFIILFLYLLRLFKYRKKVREAEKEYEKALQSDHQDFGSTDDPSNEDVSK